MAAVSSLTKRLKKLAAEIPDDRTVRDLLQSLEPEDNAFADHAIALIGASVVAKALEVAILSRLISLKEDERKRIFSYDDQGPLSDLAARIKIAYALGIFGRKTRNDLDHVRAVRNAFAHSARLIRFDTPEVAEICARLHTPTTTTALTSALSRTAGRTPRGQYIETTVTLAGRLKHATKKMPVRLGAGRLWSRDLLP